MKALSRIVALLALPALLAPGLASAQDAERSYTISPNERIHVIQRKTDLLAGRWELTLYPISAQLNSRWTEHLGFGLAGAYHLSENFALQALVDYNGYLAQETDLQTELRDKARLQPASAPSVLTQWYSVLALEMSPIYGKIAFYKDAMMHFALVLSAGAGLADTKVQIIKTPTQAEIDAAGPGQPEPRGPVFASAGMVGAGLVGAGFRVHVLDDFLVRVEVRDLIYSAQVTRLNGCNLSDLRELSGSAPTVSDACNPDSFEVLSDARPAQDRVDGSSATVNQVSAYIGFSYLF